MVIMMMMMRTVISTKRQKDTHGILYEADVVGVGVLDDDQLVVLLHVLHPLGCLQPSSLYYILISLYYILKMKKPIFYLMSVMMMAQMTMK